MSKEEFLKIQTCVLKVNIHCDGCKQKVKKILQKIDGVYKINIDSDLGKVTVSGNADPSTLIKKLGKNGKHAELWASPKPNQNPQNNLQNQLKNLQIDNGKGGNGNNLPKGGQNGQKGTNNPPKGGQIGNIPNNQQLQQQLKALQDMKLPQLKDMKLPQLKDMKLPQLKDMKLPQLKDMKMPMVPPNFGGDSNNKGQNQKNVKFDLPEEDEDDLSDGEFDDDYDDDEDDYDDDEMDDEDEITDLPPNHPLNKMKPMMGNGQVPNLMGKIENIGGGEGQNGKKGRASGVPNDGKKGGGGGENGNNGQIQGGGKNGKVGGGEGKMGNNNGANQSKGNSGGGQNGNTNVNGSKKGSGGGGGGMSDAVQGLANIGNGFPPNGAQVGNMPMGQMGPTGMGPMGQAPAVQGLPASAMGGGGGGYFARAGAEVAAGNPYSQQQQQLAAMMMNQQRANGIEQFHPMMYARPPPAVNYMPPYPYPYPYPYQYPPPGEPYAHAFSDENTSSCNVM